MPDTTLQTPDDDDRLTASLDELAEEARGLSADLRDLSGRLARFEPVAQDELDAYMGRKLALLNRIDDGDRRAAHHRATAAPPARARPLRPRRAALRAQPVPAAAMSD